MNALARLARLRAIDRQAVERATAALARDATRAEQALARIDALLAPQASDASRRAKIAGNADQLGAELGAHARDRDRLHLARARAAAHVTRAARQTDVAAAASRMARVRQEIVETVLADRLAAERHRAHASALEAEPALARGLLCRGVMSARASER